MVGPHRVEHDEDHVRLRVPPAGEAEEGNHHQESACGAVLTSGHGPLALLRHAVRGYAGWREREPLVVEPGDPVIEVLEEVPAPGARSGSRADARARSDGSEAEDADVPPAPGLVDRHVGA